ncbi:MAG TPA: prepilin peptidase [Pirellulaceae bacterium]|nr:prepilin peptidase [Pirellulaceae bacterium]
MHLALVEVDLRSARVSLELLLAIGGALLLIWLFGVGASVGSFLNVVAYRLPLGMNLVRPSSHCPYCGRAIRIYDNLPAVGWFLLGGRCRDCRAPISFRYPLVEILVGAAFVLVAVAEVFLVDAGRANAIAGTRQVLTTWEQGPLWAQYSLHALLVATLIAATLIDYDGHRTPWRLFLPVLVVGFIVPLVWPEVRRWPALAGLNLPGPLAGFVDGAVGLAAGALAGALIASAFRFGSAARRWPPFAPVPLLASVGLVMGWQWAVLIAAGALACWLIVLLAGRMGIAFRHVPLAAAVVLLYLVAMLVVPLAPGLARYAFSMPVLCVLTVLIVPLAFIAAAIAPADYFNRPKRNFALEGRPMRDFSATPSDLTPQKKSPSYLLAYEDEEFLRRAELRPVRMQLELLKPEMILTEENVTSTIVVFGSTQIVEPVEAQRRLAAAKEALAREPDNPACRRAAQRAERLAAKSRFYDAAREFARITAKACQGNVQCDYVIVTGGGPGIMEAANRGAHDIGAKSIGLNITLPQEQTPNSYITPELCFQFHYFALRKMHFLLRARALVIFPGGFGTMDELFEVLTLRQTNRMQEIPVILYCREYWERAIDFQFFADEGVIADSHLNLIQFAESPQEAWELIARFHKHAGMAHA